MFVIHRPQTQGRFLRYSPLRGCRQRDSQIPLQPLQSLEWHTATITKLRDHRRCGLVILFRACLRRLIRREHLSTAVTAQALHLVPGCLQRRPPDDPHSVFGSFWRYTFPTPHSGQASPWWRVWCGTRTVRAPVNRAALLRPCPAGLRSSSGFAFATDGSEPGGCGNTARVFSVVRHLGFTRSARMCNTALSFSASVSRSGARMPPSTIWSSSSRFTSIRGRGGVFITR